VDGRPDDGGYRVPEPRDGEPNQRYPTAAGADQQRYAEQGYGARYAEADPRGGPPESSFPGFQPPRVPPHGGRDAAVIVPPYPDPSQRPPLPPGFDGVPPAADPTATAERPRTLDPPVHPSPPNPPRPGDPMVEQPSRFHAEPINRAALRRPAGPAAPVGDGVYRTRRPAIAAALLVAVAVLELPAVRLLLNGVLGDVVSASAIVAGTFLALGLPVAALGFYALVSGAGRVPDQPPAYAWLRAPLAYLIVGLVLFLAAALAAA
jgi:hypothetical protein